MLSFKSQKSKVNILLNIGNFYGKFSGGNERIAAFMGLAGAPFLLYAIVLQKLIPFKLFIGPFILYVFYVFLITIGRQKERVDAYLKAKNNIYASARDLIRVIDVHDDGCVEYGSGRIAYFIPTYSYSYYNDDVYSKDLERFLNKILSNYEVDFYGQLVVNELETSVEDLEKLGVYKDTEFRKERLEYYKYQDQYTNENSMLYRVVYVIRASKHDWTNLRKFLADLLKSDAVLCFEDIHIAAHDEAIDIMSRDMTVYVDIGEMLRSKHSSNNYYGSKVLYFDDEIPESLKESKPTFESEEERRVIL